MRNNPNQRFVRDMEPNVFVSEIFWNDSYHLRTAKTMMVLGDMDLLLILAFFPIVMYGESRGNWAKNPVAKYYLLHKMIRFQILGPIMHIQYNRS